MSDILTADDPLYAELYDVKAEAMAFRNYIDFDPSERIAALRAKATVHAAPLRDLLGLPEHKRHALAEGKPKFCALSFAACEAVLRDHKTFSSAIVHHPNPRDEKTMGVLEMDGGEHRSYRRALQPMFLKKQTEGWWRAKWIDAAVEALVAQLQTRDRAELNLDFCARIPVHTITTAIGMNGDEALRFRMAWIKSGGVGRVPPAEQQAATLEVEKMLLDLVAKRRADPYDDVITKLLESELALPGETPRPLNDREVMLNARLIMIAGGGTSWRQMGIALFALLSNRNQLEDVRADLSLLETAIEESVRWNANSTLFCRVATDDTELEGVAIPKDGVVEVWIPAANRDPVRWDRPDIFDLHRKPINHLGFGIGQHRCLGLNVAQAEMQAGISALIDTFPDMRLDPQAAAPFITGGLEQRGVSGLPVLLR
jgi:cytochrome P450